MKMNPRVIITFILFILFSFILASNEFVPRGENNEADLNPSPDAYVALPIGGNLESGSNQKRDMKSILSRIGQNKRHQSHRIPASEKLQQGNETNTAYSLYPDLPSNNL